MKIQEFTGTWVRSNSDGNGIIEKVIYGKNTYFRVQFESGKQKTFRVPRAFLSGALSTENADLINLLNQMSDVEVKPNEDLPTAKELGISLSDRCALTSKNLAMIGVLDDFYGLYSEIYSEFMREMVEYTAEKMRKEGKEYDGSISFHLTSSMENNARQHFGAVLNRNVNIITNEYETFFAKKSEFRYFPYFVANRGRYRRATFQEFCDAIEWIYIDTIYK